MKTILFVDDDEATRQTFGLLLEDEGNQVLLARNGLEAVAKISENAVDLVITDWSMPGMDGVTLCRTLRADPLHCSIPIVLMSSAEAPAEAGLWDAFFRKPVSWLAVGQTVRDLVAVPCVGAAAVRGSDPAQVAVSTSQLDSMPLVALDDQPRNANAQEDPQVSRLTRTSTPESK
ncbi:response regulator [Burkholderia cepacia]|uniref:response regulator n=1 Tax=Burkholderia cepacia TaxID=292 RepID=UPI00190326D2|nr:response regulator [Burkholderia cepacia]MBJ9752210.1 response regulator [Burkholderia cepacia]